MRTVVLAVLTMLIASQALACASGKPDPVLVTIGGVEVDLIEAAAKAGTTINGVLVDRVQGVPHGDFESRAVEVTLKKGGETITQRLAYPPPARAAGGCNQPFRTPRKK